MTSRVSRPLYPAVSETLAALASDLEAAEAHGLLCGLLCDPARFEVDIWLAQLMGEAEAPRFTELPKDSPLVQMLAGTLRELADEGLSLRLVLPDDDTPLFERTAALGAWCRGFLSGFGMQVGDRALTEDGQELLRDLINISRIDPDDRADEVGERDFLDVLEYVRLGALMLQAENRNPLEAESSSLH